jgi:hypothetical protein
MASFIKTPAPNDDTVLVSLDSVRYCRSSQNAGQDHIHVRREPEPSARHLDPDGRIPDTSLSNVAHGVTCAATSAAATGRTDLGSLERPKVSPD